MNLSVVHNILIKFYQHTENDVLKILYKICNLKMIIYDFIKRYIVHYMLILYDFLFTLQ